MVRGFNSMKVRLKPLLVLVHLCSVLCFNSMKVRLKLDFSMSFDPVSAFQFHEGPIKTLLA